MASTVQECNFTVHKGASLNARLCLRDSEGNPTNLEGYTVRGVVKHRYGDTSSILNLNPVIVSGYCPGEYCGYNPDPVISGYIKVLSGFKIDTIHNLYFVLVFFPIKIA